MGRGRIRLNYNGYILLFGGGYLKLGTCQALNVDMTGTRLTARHHFPALYYHAKGFFFPFFILFIYLKLS